VTRLAAVLADLDAAGAFDEPEFFLPQRSDRYARRLVQLDPDRRFVVVAITWAPGQGSPLHDHAGLWGVEIVARGIMHETVFRLEERDDRGRYRFADPRPGVTARGQIGVLIPPLEYHDFGNGGEAVAHTVHVYGGNLTHAQAFVPDGDGWHRATAVELHYDG